MNKENQQQQQPQQQQPQQQQQQPQQQQPQQQRPQQQQQSMSRRKLSPSVSGGNARLRNGPRLRPRPSRPRDGIGSVSRSLGQPFANQNSISDYENEIQMDSSMATKGSRGGGRGRGGGGGGRRGGRRGGGAGRSGRRRSGGGSSSSSSSSSATSGMGKKEKGIDSSLFALL